MLIGLTNKPGDIDNSLKRGGRFDYEIKMDMPTAIERYQILKNHLSDVEHSIQEQDLVSMANAASGFVASDLVAIVRNSLLKATINIK